MQSSTAGLMSIGLAEGFTEAQVEHQIGREPDGTCASLSCRPAALATAKERITDSRHIGRRQDSVSRLRVLLRKQIRTRSLCGGAALRIVRNRLESVIVEPGPYPSHLLSNSPGPEDLDRLTDYGELAQLRQRFVEHFAQLFSSAESPDTQEVADAILHLVELPPGTRPMRTVCGLDFGATEVNRTLAPFQAEVLRALGMEAMTPRVVTQHVGKASA